MKRVLISIAHSDDETIGCGGTIAKHVSQGDKVFCISMTDGVGARFKNSADLKPIKERKKSAINASKKLGFKWLPDFCGNFPDNGLDAVKLLDIIKVIEKAKKKINPHIVYTHDFNDLNVDHKIISEATLTAFRPHYKESCENILAMEIPSATDYGSFKGSNNFYPNYFVDITDTWKHKLSALRFYNKEIKKYPNSRSYEGIETYAKFRGIQVGFRKAEAFRILRQLSK
jgi:LmbE family N-acetylglucosaminyl deacetylase